jgi:topoisomerase-4 subunit A
MNVLSKGIVPKVLEPRRGAARMARSPPRGAAAPLGFRLAQIEAPAGSAGGYLIAYLNLDEVIRIIREEDEPKQELMRPSLTDLQAESILNMRLRSLRKLEEFEIRKEARRAVAPRKGRSRRYSGPSRAVEDGRLADPPGPRHLRPETALGKRRTVLPTRRSTMSRISSSR